MYAGLEWYHLYGSCGAFACAESAWFAVFDGYAEVACPYGVSDLYGCSFFDGDGLYGGCGADFRASCAFGAAVSAFEAYFGLHEVVEAAAGSEYVVGACVDAELAGCAVCAQVSDGE